jgi:hypothetical protein
MRFARPDERRTETGRRADFGGRRTAFARHCSAKFGFARLLEKKIFSWLYRRVSREEREGRRRVAYWGNGWFALFRLLVGAGYAYRVLRIAYAEWVNWFAYFRLFPLGTLIFAWRWGARAGRTRMEDGEWRMATKAKKWPKSPADVSPYVA